jgi:hypothetical protein
MKTFKICYACTCIMHIFEISYIFWRINGNYTDTSSLHILTPVFSNILTFMWFNNLIFIKLTVVKFLRLKCVDMQFYQYILKLCSDGFGGTN